MAPELASVIFNKYSLSTEVTGEARYWGVASSFSNTFFFALCSELHGDQIHHECCT